MFSTSNSQYLNELICEMRRLSEVPVECKYARILLAREISKVFEEVQKIGAFGEVRTPAPSTHSAMSINKFLPQTTSTPFPSKAPRDSLPPFSLSNLTNPFVTPIKNNYANQDGDWQELTPESPSPMDDVVLQTKIYIPEPPRQMGGRPVKCNYIGRILGPSGMSARMIERQYDVTLLIRGAGSIRHTASEELLRGKKGYEHLDEPLHVLLIARHTDRAKCEQMLDAAASKVESLLTPVHDDYKKEQLVRFAIMNGTYEERPRKKKQSMTENV